MNIVRNVDTVTLSLLSIDIYMLKTICNMSQTCLGPHKKLFSVHLASSSSENLFLIHKLLCISVEWNNNQYAVDSKW